MIPFPFFEPDKSAFNFGAGDNLLNCLPKADGWGPQPDVLIASDALPSLCKGAVSVVGADGSVSVYAGTASNLYKLNSATTPYSWTEVSKSTDAYTLADDSRWQFTLFGDRLIAHHVGDPAQYVDLSGAVNFADLPNAPQARYSCVAGDFLMFGNLLNEPRSVQWSGLNDSEYWTVGRRHSDKQEIPDGGNIQGLQGNENGALVFLRERIHAMLFSPASGFTFTGKTANPSRGVISAHSIAQVGPGQFMYLSKDGFSAGVEGRPIGAERVDRWFDKTVDKDELHNVTSMVDPFEKIVWWRFKSLNGNSVLLGYDWQLDRWCYSDINLTEAAAITPAGYTWDGLDSLYANIDSANVSFDSRFLSGGTPAFAGFTSDHKLAFLSGTNRAATLETATIELHEGDRSFVNECRLVSDAQTATMQAACTKDHSTAPTYDPAVSASTRTGIYPMRCDGKLHRFKLLIPAADPWTIASGVRPNAAPAGHL